MKRLLFTILILLYAFNIQAQETKVIAKWDNSKTTDLGNGNKRFEMVMKPSWYAEYDKNITGSIIQIRSISGKDTVAFIPSGFDSLTYGKNNSGNFEFTYKKSKDSTFTINMINDFSIVQDVEITDIKTGEKYKIDKHIRVGKAVIKDIWGIDDNGQKVEVIKLEKIGNKIIGKTDGKVSKIDPVIVWQDTSRFMDAQLDGDAPTSNYGTLTSIQVGQGGGAPCYSGVWVRGLKDTMVAKGVTTLTSLKLKLYKRSLWSGDSIRVYAETNDSTFTESQVTYNTRPPTSTPYSDDTTKVTVATDSISLNITTFGRAVLAGTQLDSGITIKYFNSGGANNFFRMHSAESDTLARIMKVVMDYVASPLKKATLALSNNLTSGFTKIDSVIGNGNLDTTYTIAVLNMENGMYLKIDDASQFYQVAKTWYSRQNFANDSILLPVNKLSRLKIFVKNFYSTAYLDTTQYFINRDKTWFDR